MHGLHIKFLKHVLIQFLKAILTPCFVSIPNKQARQISEQKEKNSTLHSQHSCTEMNQKKTKQANTESSCLILAFKVNLEHFLWGTASIIKRSSMILEIHMWKKMTFADMKIVRKLWSFFHHKRTYYKEVALIISFFLPWNNYFLI